MGAYLESRSVPDAITMPAGPLSDSDELLAKKRVKRVDDADKRRRRGGIGCT